MNKILSLIALLAVVTQISACGVEVIDSGHRGVQKKFGEVNDVVLTEGIHYYNPFTSTVIEIDTRSQSADGKDTTYTKDVQAATLNYTITYNLKPSTVAQVYKKVGTDWKDIILFDLVQDSFKGVIGKWDAVTLIGKLDAISPQVVDALRLRIAEKAKTLELDSDVVRINSFALTKVKYEEKFERAVEAKVTAIQKAEEEKNKTVQIEEQAAQKVITATAEAEAIKIKTEALKESKSLIELRAVEKWNGVLPVYMLGSGTTPFINLNKERK